MMDEEKDLLSVIFLILNDKNIICKKVIHF